MQESGAWEISNIFFMRLGKISFFLLFSILYGCKKVNKDCNLKAYSNAPEKDWFVSYNGSKEESHGHFILSCSDGGYLQVGETGFLSNSSKLLIIKTNSQGDLVWKKEFFEGGHNLGNSAIETSDGYVICGALNENSTVIKLEKITGSLIFQESINNGGNDAFEHITQVDNGFVVVGYTDAQDPLNTFYTEGKGYVSFLNKLGVKQKGISLNGYLSHAYRIKEFDNELIISGLTEGSNDYGLIKMDTTGLMIWNKVFGGVKADHCFGMDVNSIGEIFLTGHTLSGTENWDTYTLKIDNNGKQLWQNKSGNPRGFDPKFIHDEAWGVKGTGDGGCIVVAGTGDEYGNYKRKCGPDGDNSNFWHVYLIKYSSSGLVDWQQTYGGEKGVSWAGEDIDITDDGGIIIAVDNGGFGFLKIDSFQETK